MHASPGCAALRGWRLVLACLLVTAALVAANSDLHFKPHSKPHSKPEPHSELHEPRELIPRAALKLVYDDSQCTGDELYGWLCYKKVFDGTAPFALPPFNHDVAPTVTDFHYDGRWAVPVYGGGGYAGGPAGSRAERITVVVTTTSTDPTVGSINVALWGAENGTGNRVYSEDVTAVGSGHGEVVWQRDGRDIIVTHVIATTQDPNARLALVEVNSAKFELEFSKRDWTRILGYDPLYSGLIVPETSDASSSPLWAGYQANFKDVLLSFYGLVGKTQPGYNNQNQDRVTQWKQGGDWSARWVCQNATANAGAAIADWLIRQKTTGVTTDQQRLDWRAIPGLPAVGAWVESVFQAWWDIQNMEQGSTGFGWFANKDDVYNSTALLPQNTDMIFSNYPLLVHFAGLLSDDFLRTSRVHAGAAYAGLLNGVPNGFVQDPLHPEKWEIGRIGLSSQTMLAFCIAASFQITSEWHLRDRGTWNDATDGISTTVPSAGLFTNDYMKTMCEKGANQMLADLQRYGLVEFQTDYTEDPVWALWTLPTLMTYAPTAASYSAARSMLQIIWQDLSAHWMPAIGDCSAPSHRMTADFITGLRLNWEANSDLQFPSVVQAPMCQLVDSTGCAPTYGVPPAAGISTLVDASPTAFAMVYRSMLAGGLGWNPFSTFDTFVANPLRVVKQHFRDWRGQDRINFLAPGYTIGTSGPDQETMGSSINQVARLMGTPTSQPQLDPQTTTQPTPLTRYEFFGPNPIMIWTSNRDDVYASSRDQGVVPGGFSDARLLNFHVAAQHQSFILHTFMAVDGGYKGGSQPSWLADSSLPIPPLVTSILVPLGVDGLFVNGSPLPTDDGTCLIIPTDAVITARHADASVVTRVLLSEHTPAVQDSTGAVRPCSVAPAGGVYQNALVWRVDSTTKPFNSGRLVLVHRPVGNPGGSDPRSVFRIALLQGAGVTRSDAEREALEQVFSQADATITSAASAGWSSLNTVSSWDRVYCGDYCNQCDWTLDHRWRKCPENIQWTAHVALDGPGGQAQLEVQRHDYFGGSYLGEATRTAIVPLPNGVVMNAILSQPPPDRRNQDLYWAPPITTTPFARLVNGVEMVFPTDGTTIVDGVSSADYFQPHLARDVQKHDALVLDAQKSAVASVDQPTRQRKPRHSRAVPKTASAKKSAAAKAHSLPAAKHSRARKLSALFTEE